MTDICLWKDFSYVFFAYHFFPDINNICSIFFSVDVIIHMTDLTQCLSVA